MSMYVSFTISEGIADRGEVTYAVWEEWLREDYTFGPFDSIVCVYGTLEGYDEATGERTPIAHLVNDPNDPYDGYWRVVKEQITSRHESGRMKGMPRGYSYPQDETLPPFSDWFIDTEPPATPREIRRVDLTAEPPAQLPPASFIAQGAH